MRKKKRRSTLGQMILMCCLMLAVAFGFTVQANAEEESAAVSLPTGHNNLVIGLRDKSELVATEDGYMRVFYDGTKIGIEYYDDAFQVLSKTSVPMELDLWGGFYASENAYYIVTGQNNTAESYAREVIRVIKYDKEWNRIGAANITGNKELFGGDIRYPFDEGCVEFAEKDGCLYIVTGHEGYVDPEYNQGHQGFLMLEVDTASMSGRIVACDLGHSFAQYIKQKDGMLYVLEQSEGSRCTKLSRYDGTASSSWGTLKKDRVEVLNYGGERTSAWAIDCYATVDDLQTGTGNILTVGTSIDQTQYDTSTKDTPYNIYLTVTPADNFTKEATKVLWMTDYQTAGKKFRGVKLTKINDNKFLLMWEETDEIQEADVNDVLSDSILHYVFIDENGQRLGQEYTGAATMSDCHPIVKGSDIVYYASYTNMVNFYTIHAETGDFSKKSYQLAGENALWRLENGVLTISGSGDLNQKISSGWLNALKKKTEAIVISEGITSIPASSFTDFTNLKTITIGPGCKRIGEKAFYGCGAVDITIPDSVTEIGKDILWTGYSWVSGGHVYEGTIYATCTSAAIEYAEQYRIKNVKTHKWSEEYTIDREPTCSKEGSKSHHCTLCDEIDADSVCSVDKTPHTVVIDSAVEPTITTDGLTEGCHCQVCEEIIVKQIVVPAIGIPIDETIFPDEAFRTYVTKSFDKDFNGRLSGGELVNILMVNVTRTNVRDLTGMEYFINLRYLHCSGDKLSKLDVSKNKNLSMIDCSGNQLTSLDVSKNAELTDLQCYENQLGKLDVSKNSELSKLYCYGNQLTSLDVSKNEKLTELACFGNQYTVSLSSDNTYDLASLKPLGFEPEKADGWSGGTVEGTVVTFNSKEVTYQYDVGSTEKVTFKLVAEKYGEESSPTEATTETKPETPPTEATTETKPETPPTEATTETKPETPPTEATTETKPDTPPTEATTETKPDTPPTEATTETKPDTPPTEATTETKPDTPPTEATTETKPESQPGKAPVADPVIAGKTVKDAASRAYYKIAGSKAKGYTATYLKPAKKNLTTVTIPASIKVKGIACKVTAMANNALKNQKKLKRVTIGANVKTIGNNAFNGCKNLKTITIKSQNIKKVGTKAFSGIHKKAVIKIPKQKRKAYKKLFSKKTGVKASQVK